MPVERAYLTTPVRPPYLRIDQQAGGNTSPNQKNERRTLQHRLIIHDLSAPKAAPGFATLSPF